jgi:hypothetical protein
MRFGARAASAASGCLRLGRQVQAGGVDLDDEAVADAGAIELQRAAAQLQVGGY